MVNTVKMFNPDNGMSGDIHPAEVENMKACGWRMAVEPMPLPPPPPSSSRPTLKLKS